MKRMLWTGTFLLSCVPAALGQESNAGNQPVISFVDIDTASEGIVAWQNTELARALALQKDDESDSPFNPVTYLESTDTDVTSPSDMVVLGQSGRSVTYEPLACDELACDTIACDAPIVCRPRSRFANLYAGVEFLNWWSSGQDIPVLIAADDGLPPAPAIFGGDEVGGKVPAAVRVTLGRWLDDCRESALLFRGYGVEGSFAGAAGSSDGTPGIAIPFINDSSNVADQGNPDAFIIAGPGLLQPGTTGSVSAAATNDIFGGDVMLRRLFSRGRSGRIDWLLGYQYTNIDDAVSLRTSTNRTGVGNPTFTTFDHFEAENHFNAGTIGMMLECCRGPVTLQVISKFGFGNMNQQVSIRGNNSVNGAVTGGGIFAQDQSAAGGPNFNIGDYERDEFAWSPELNINTIWSLRKHVDLTIGYSFIYWSNVALAGDHIDTTLNNDVFFDGNFIAGGGSNPDFNFTDTHYWAHSLDLGLLMRY